MLSYPSRSRQPGFRHMTTTFRSAIAPNPSCGREPAAIIDAPAAPQGSVDHLQVDFTGPPKEFGCYSESKYVGYWKRRIDFVRFTSAGIQSCRKLLGFHRIHFGFWGRSHSSGSRSPIRRILILDWLRLRTPGAGSTGPEKNAVRERQKASFAAGWPSGEP
jgi:hypothetical protein